MTANNLPVAILAAAGFEESHLTEVQKALLAHNIETKVISPDGGLVQGWHEDGWGHHFMADDSLAEVLSADFSALVVPAGDRSVDTLLQNPHTVRLIKAFAEADKPIAVLGEAGALLAAAEIANGRRVAASPETQADLAKAGAVLADEPVTVDGTVISTAVTFEMDILLDALAKVLSTDDEVVRAA